MTSGAIQFGVPLTSFAAARPRVDLIAFRLSETPKSDSLMLPFLVERTLAAVKWEVCQPAACEGPRREKRRALEIAMHDALGMEVGESFEHLEDVGGDERLGKLAILLDRLRERAALGESAVQAGESSERGRRSPPRTRG